MEHIDTDINTEAKVEGAYEFIQGILKEPQKMEGVIHFFILGGILLLAYVCVMTFVGMGMTLLKLAVCSTILYFLCVIFRPMNLVSILPDIWGYKTQTLFEQLDAGVRSLGQYDIMRKVSDMGIKSTVDAIVNAGQVISPKGIHDE